MDTTTSAIDQPYGIRKGTIGALVPRRYISAETWALRSRQAMKKMPASHRLAVAGVIPYRTFSIMLSRRSAGYTSTLQGMHTWTLNLFL